MEENSKQNEEKTEEELFAKGVFKKYFDENSLEKDKIKNILNKAKADIAKSDFLKVVCVQFWGSLVELIRVLVPEKKEKDKK